MTITNPVGEISLVTLGGTISMQNIDGLAVPVLDADGVAGLLGADHGLRCVEVARVGGSQVDFEHLRALTSAISELVISATTGVIVTTGTDSIEETAAWLTYTGPWPVPVVITGSMLPGGEPDGDAPANLNLALAAVRAEITTEPVVAFAGRTWLGRAAQKVSGTELDAFATPGRGPLAVVNENGGLTMLTRPPRPATTLGPPGAILAPVPLVVAAMGADGDHLRRVAADQPAVVVGGNGAGNLPPALAEAAVDVAASGTLVAVATRVADAKAGAVYGYPGSGGRLVSAGVVLTPGMTPHQLRVFLSLAHSQTPRPHDLRSALLDHLETL